MSDPTQYGFAVGDFVRHKLGGPRMVVDVIGGALGWGVVRCTWFNKNDDVVWSEFPAACLEAAK